MEIISRESFSDLQELHKEALRKRLDSVPVSSLLRGQGLKEVILNNSYTPLSASLENEEEESLLESVISQKFGAGSEGCRVALCGGGGMGKTTAVEQLIWDWTTGARLQHFTFVLPVCVRSLCTGEESLKSVLLRSNTHLSAESLELVLQKTDTLLLVLDGLDLYQNLLSDPPPDSAKVSDPEQPAGGGVLLHSLLEGSLLPGASLLITSREPVLLDVVQHVHLLGFSQAQRSAYFRQFFKNQTEADQVLQHCEQAVGMAELCVSPAFCWTLCCVCKPRLQPQKRLPETLTELYCVVTHTLLQEQEVTNTETNKELLGCLAKLAVHNKPLTYADLMTSGLQPFLDSPLLSASLHISGDALTSPKSTFSFRSPVFQDFLLAASFYFDQSEKVQGQILEQHAGLYHSFLAGLSDPAQRKLLETCVGRFSSGHLSEFHQWLVGMVPQMLTGFSLEKHKLVFRLLHHAHSPALVREIMSSSKWRTISYGQMRGPDLAALGFVVKCMGEMEHLNLYRSELTEEHVRRLIPALQLAKSIDMCQSRISEGVVIQLARWLMDGCVVQLNLSETRLDPTAVQTLCTSLTHSNLHTLQLRRCELTPACSEALARMLSGSKLCVLDLGANALSDEGMNELVRVLGNSTCRLQELSLNHCSLSAACLPALCSSLTCALSELRSLNLTSNSLCEDTLHHLSQALQSGRSKLTKLNLFSCELTNTCCPSLVAALLSDNCSLTELDLSVNELYQSGASIICDALKSPKCRLEKLCMANCELTEEVFSMLGSALVSGNCKLKELEIGCNRVGDAAAKQILKALKDTHCRLEYLDLEMVDLTDGSLDELCEAVATSNTLTTLILKNNTLTDDSVPRLVQLVQDRPIMKELNLQYNDFSEDVFELMESCPVIRY